MDFALELSPAARRDLKRLPPKIRKKIMFIYLPKIQEKPFEVGKPLQGALRGERCYRFGRKPEYRIVYYVENEVITVTIIGTRENIYKQARQRLRKE